MRKSYWVIGRLDRCNKRFLFVAIVKPIWTSIVQVVRRRHNIALRTIVAARRSD